MRSRTVEPQPVPYPALAEWAVRVWRDHLLREAAKEQERKS